MAVAREGGESESDVGSELQYEYPAASRGGVCGSGVPAAAAAGGGDGAATSMCGCVDDISSRSSHQASHNVFSPSVPADA